jgi:hypothetical protein
VASANPVAAFFAAIGNWLDNWWPVILIIMLALILIDLLRRVDIGSLRTKVFGTKDQESSASTYKRTITEEPYRRPVDEAALVDDEPHITSVGIRKTEETVETTRDSKLVEAES